MQSAMSAAPLAKRMTPRTLEEFVGQEHVLGEGKILRRAIEADRVSSMILYGPPGCGKSALANVIAARNSASGAPGAASSASGRTQAYVERVNAVTIGVGDIRKMIDQAKDRQGMFGQKTVLFLDEIHRFNKLQQDALLPDVESGLITLIGATTHNPFFYVNQALQSRSLIVELRPLGSSQLRHLLDRALQDAERGLGRYRVKMVDEAAVHLIESAGGDARLLLNALEIGVVTTPPDAEGVVQVTLEVAEASLQKPRVKYDGGEDEHYDTASAFIKSLRGSDPDAALYWMAKMLVAGEDPRFVARRIAICAAEDVGNADPQALVVANAAFQISEWVGMPEARIPLAQAAVYVACAPKSNAAYVGIDRAMKEVATQPLQEVPNHLKDSGRDAKSLGHGQGYQYPHEYPGHFIEQVYWPHPKKFYDPSDQGFEETIRERMKARRPPR